jgi:hypothetical protein
LYYNRKILNPLGFGIEYLKEVEKQIEEAPEFLFLDAIKDGNIEGRFVIKNQ